MAKLFEGISLSPSERSEGWRRVRVGAAGVGGILLLLAATSTMIDRLKNQTQPVAAGQQAKAAQKPTDAKTEPMAELGVQPDAAPANKTPAK